jgi:putative addiction module component (TIGR02574 family)
MSNLFPLHQLSTNEKLILMEQLWTDLSNDPASIPVPAWHQEILDERIAEVQNGTAELLDWEVVKQELRKLTP